MSEGLPQHVADELRASLDAALPPGFHERLEARRAEPAPEPRSATRWLAAFYAVNGVLMALGLALAVAVEASHHEVAPVQALLRAGFMATLLGMVVGLALLGRVGPAIAEEAPTYATSPAVRLATGALVFSALAAVGGLNVVWATLRILVAGGDGAILGPGSPQMISLDGGILAAMIAVAFMQRLATLVRRARSAPEA